MSDTSQTPYTPAEAAFAARVSKEAGAEAVFVFAYNLTFDNAYTDGLAAIAGSALYCASSPDSALEKLDVPAGSEFRYVQSVGCCVHRIRVGGRRRRAAAHRYAPRARVPERGDAAARAERGPHGLRRAERIPHPLSEVRQAVSARRRHGLPALRRPQKAAAPALAVCKAEPEAAAGRRGCSFSPSARSTC